MKFLGLVLCTPLLLAGCGGSGELEGTAKVIEVDSYLQSCIGEAVAVCMRIREDGESDYTLFYDSITGFDYDFGYSYTLEVEELMISDPPQDGSSLEWKLVQVVSKVEDDIGTEYSLSFSGNLDSAVTLVGDEYQVFDINFSCLPELDCGSLLDLHNNLAPPAVHNNLELRFQYAGDSKLVLISHGQIL